MNRRVAAVPLVVLSLLLGGCATGFSAQTNQQYQAGAGADHRSGDVEVLGAALVANADGSATVSAGLLNTTSTQRALTDVTVTDDQGDPLDVTSSHFLLALRPDELARVGQISDAGGYVVTSGADAGRDVSVTWSFSSGPDVTMDVPVVARTATYDGVSTGVTTH